MKNIDGNCSFLVVFSNWHNPPSILFWVSFNVFSVFYGCRNNSLFNIWSQYVLNKNIPLKYADFNICSLRIAFFELFFNTRYFLSQSGLNFLFYSSVSTCSIGFCLFYFLVVELVIINTRGASFDKTQRHLLEFSSHKIVVAVSDI